MKRNVIIVSSILGGLVIIWGLIFYYSKKKGAEAAKTTTPDLAVNYIDSKIPNDYYTDLFGNTSYVGVYA